MKKLNYYLIFLFAASFLYLQFGCSSSKQAVNENDTFAESSTEQSDYDEIEKLLGITRTDQQQPASETQAAEQESGNDDLIKLLEVDEGKEKEKTQADAASTEDKRVVRLQQQVETLQKDLNKKELEVADLRAQLMLSKNNSEIMTATDFSAGSSRTRVTATAGKSGVASESYKSAYQEGLIHFKERRYRDAISVFEQLLATDTANDYSDNAQYWIGESYYAMGRYREAILAFEKVFTFKYSNKNDYAQFKIGQCYFMLGDKKRSRQEFQALVDNYPESTLIDRTQEYMAQL